MRCGKARKLMPDLAEGLLGARKATRVEAHVGACGDCAEAWEREETVTELLPAWTEAPLPEDALHRIETRIAFAPPPAALPRPGVVRTFVLPYAAGLATAAAALLFFRGPSPAPGEAPGAPVLTRGAEAMPILSAGERPLQFVDEAGHLMEAPWNAEMDRWLRGRMPREQYESLRDQYRRVNTEPLYEVK